MVTSAPLITQFRYSVAVTSVHAHFVLSLHSDSGPTGASKKLLEAGRRHVCFYKASSAHSHARSGAMENFLGHSGVQGGQSVSTSS